MCMLIMVIFNTKFRCMLIAINFHAKNFVSVLYAKYGDYGTLMGGIHLELESLF